MQWYGEYDEWSAWRDPQWPIKFVEFRWVWVATHCGVKQSPSTKRLQIMSLNWHWRVILRELFWQIWVPVVYMFNHSFSPREKEPELQYAQFSWGILLKYKNWVDGWRDILVIGLNKNLFFKSNSQKHSYLNVFWLYVLHFPHKWWPAEREKKWCHPEKDQNYQMNLSDSIMNLWTASKTTWFSSTPSSWFPCITVLDQTL